MFHVGYYMLMVIKKGLSLIRVDVDWKKTQRYIDISEEACQQVDIAFIVKRMMFFDAAISKLMEKHEVKALCMQKKPTLKKAKEIRKKYYLNEIFRMNQEKQEEELGLEKGIAKSKQKVMASEQISSGSKVEEASEDYSVAEMSEEDEEEMSEIEDVIRRIKSESKRGRQMSIRIMEEMDPHILEHYEQKRRERRRKDSEKVMAE